MPTPRVRRLDKNHDPYFGGGAMDYCSGAEAAQQSLRCRLLSLLGDWFLNLSHGVPWWQPDDSDTQPIMGGARNLQYAEATLKTAILGTDGVATLDTFSLSVNGRTRKLTVSCSGTTVDGGAFTIVDAGPPGSN